VGLRSREVREMEGDEGIEYEIQDLHRLIQLLQNVSVPDV
jgi:hypothetical protein